MSRTTAAAVRATFDADFAAETGNRNDVTDAQIDRHITRASHLVDRVAAQLEDTGAGEAVKGEADRQNLLAELETLVAQHYLATQLPRPESQSGPSRSISFQGSTSEGFMATQYGQDAVLLDPTNVLVEADQPVDDDIIFSG